VPVKTSVVFFAWILLITPRKKRWFLPFSLGLLLVLSTQLPLIRETLGPLGKTPLFELLTRPTPRIALGALGTILMLWGLMKFFFTSQSNRIDLAQQLKRRKDYSGAAEIMLEAGRFKEALSLAKKAKDWKGAAVAAEKLGKPALAANFYRESGGEDLTRAIKIFQRLGDRDQIRQCRHEYAGWLSAKGRLNEALEMWVRSSEYSRASRLAKLALEKGRLSTSHSSFKAAKKAAAETRNHQLLAELAELEESWGEAGRYWKIAGDRTKAATAFARGGRYVQAADMELAAGRPERAANHLLEALRQMRSHRIGVTSGSENLDADFHRLTEKLIPLLEKLGRTRELVEVLSQAGRSDEAINYLLEKGMPDLAGEIAIQVEQWDMAALIYEDLKRWTEASDAYERAGRLEKAAQCAELAGEDQTALEHWRKLNRSIEAAHCLARIGSLEDGLRELHAQGNLEEACNLLQAYPGPVPDIPEIILDMAEFIKGLGKQELCISILQRAVLGVALQEHRLGPALALAHELVEVGDFDQAQAQVDRILAFNYANEQAQTLKRKILRSRRVPDATIPSKAGDEGTEDFAQRYEIQHELGSGGMGVVYLAHDRKLARDVAIKVLRTTSEEEAQRLKNEAMAAATLNHPGIVTIFDFEAGFDGYFIAMEYVPGKTLSEVLKEDPSRVRNRLGSILLQIAEALVVAHDAQIIHRDLKPANILLTDSDRVKVLDFGIAARLDVDSSGGGVCGTPYYMAPEQIRGEMPTPATDIYSLGTTAYHLATGHPPFRKGNVIQAQLEKKPKDPCEENPELSRELGNIILRCLEKDPTKRFEDCRRLADALRTLT